ncbi:MAG: hypothetical protein IPL69_20345 [Saprospiraceae bacterium]|nr:hypothetical protein [Candidatus Brachybacter algidus]
MGFFAFFPDAIGLALWNLLNALILCIAVYSLPKTKSKTKRTHTIDLCFELMTSMQNSQSNALMAGLLILSFAFMEKTNCCWQLFA